MLVQKTNLLTLEVRPNFQKLHVWMFAVKTLCRRALRACGSESAVRLPLEAIAVSAPSKSRNGTDAKRIAT